nr:hypothetical protein BJQ95_01400 [Cryobacterium sp. SO1]
MPHDHRVDRAGAQLEGLVHEREVRHRLTRFQAAGRGHDHRGSRIVDPHGELAGREAAEDHRVHGPDPGAGEHGHDGFGDHRQVDHHPVAPAHAVGPQHPGEPGHPVEELAVADPGLGAGHRRVVDQRGVVAATREHVPVEGVVAGVEGAVGEPAVIGGGALRQRRGRRTDPVDLAGGIQPEAFALVDAAPPDIAVESGASAFGHGANLSIEALMYTQGAVSLAQTVQ